MRRSITIVVCMAVAGLGVQPASANILDKTVTKCETTATWQVTRGETSYADMTFDTSAPTGCKRLNVEVEDDLNFLVRNYDDALIGGATYRYNLVGAIVTGAPQFAGVALDPGGRVRGTVTIADTGVLTATLTGVTANGGTLVEEHLPDGGCGAGCYRTKVILTGVYDF
ncbi:MAG TPA: hypothetical protein VF715_10110 [Thermoleophilaceae bacterium]